MAEVAKTSSGRDNLMKMLLTSGATAPPAASPTLPSPTGDTFDDNPNRFTTYLHQLAGCYEIEVDVIVRDHCYARPWNWKPENVYVKPIKKIFFGKNSSSDKLKSEENVNVENYNDGHSSPPYDLGRTRQLMDELQRLANFVRPDEDSEWEEKIDKTYWTPVQIRIFAKVVRILTAERLARLAKAGHVMEPVFRRTTIDTAAKRFRETLASIGWDVRITQWIHSLMFDYLPQEYLVIYLDILQTLRLKIPQLIDKMIAVQTNINGKGGPVTWETLGSLLKRSWDPVIQTLNSNKPKKLPGNPILVIAPSGIGTSASPRQHKWVSQLGALGMVVTVYVPLGLTSTKMTMMACVDQLVQATRTKIQEVRSDCPGRPIILLGYNTGAALACQVAQMEHVTAVICLGFPFNTVEGKRGSPDDTLMDIRCPVMFVIGQNSTLVRPDDLEDLREKMLVETSLVVVGTADDHLRISTAKKLSEGITQSMVDRCILDEIGDFVGSILLQPHPLPLRPVTLPNLDARIKKECRKRRNSTSSSVESEPNSPNVKKSRPGTPVMSAASIGQSVPSTSVSRAGTLTTNMIMSGSSANLTPGPKRKPRVVNSQKMNFSETVISPRLMAQSVNSGNGGITLNIGSLASLAPVGPIRFSPASAGQSSPGTTKTNIPKSPAAFQKAPRMIHMGNPNVGKMKNIPVAGGSQIKPNASPTQATHMKSPSSTSGTLTALLQSGKHALSGIGRAITSSVLLTPSVTVTPTTSATPLTPSKVADISGPAKMNDHLPTSPTTSKDMSFHQSVNHQPISHHMSQSSKIYSSKSNNLAMLDNSRNSRNSSNSYQNSVTILPFSSRIKPSEKPVKIIPKITVNNFPRAQRPRRQSPAKNYINDELGNILDIPIIFAKDGESINSIEKAPPLPQVPENPLPQRNPKLGPTKVVLISNKQDKCQPPGKFINPPRQAILRPSLPNQNMNHVLLHPRSQNPIITSRPNISMQNSIRGTQPTIKYTKIILAKRNSLPSTSHKDKGEPVILTKNNQKAPVPRIFSADKSEHRYAQIVPKMLESYEEELLEIEEAIKANIIERKVTDLPKVDILSTKERLNENRIQQEESQGDFYYSELHHI
ncbi:KAT8 regulatory NSL complex subunit 3 isoform X2 [Belonocnema kinseyi]|uniref:KAT8 regulatory NSL complex subunit 3 isoform X2 n=1 Tax=Belonocnema kinseyi TaxID=2817044 RepID=UPI00143D3E50|nr:KAT8 regulatory NSL complex subunit 3 isoform X2 [Belonocnema kinseyi]